MAIIANAPVFIIKNNRLSISYLIELEKQFSFTVTSKWTELEDIFFLSYDPTTRKIVRVPAKIRKVMVKQPSWKILHPSGMYFYSGNDEPNVVLLSKMDLDGGGIEINSKIAALRARHGALLTYEKYLELKRISNGFSNLRALDIKGGDLEMIRLLLGFTVKYIQKNAHIISPQSARNALLGNSTVALDRIINFLSSRIFPSMRPDEIIVSSKKAPERIRIPDKELFSIIFALMLTGLLQFERNEKKITIVKPGFRRGNSICENVARFLGHPSTESRKKITWKNAILFEFLHSFSPREVLSQELKYQRKTAAYLYELSLPVRKQYSWTALALASNVGAEVISTPPGVSFTALTPMNLGVINLHREHALVTFYEVPKWIVLPGVAIE